MFLIHKQVNLRISPKITVISVLHKDGKFRRLELGKLISAQDNYIHAPMI